MLTQTRLNVTFIFAVCLVILCHIKIKEAYVFAKDNRPLKKFNRHLHHCELHAGVKEQN